MIASAVDWLQRGRIGRWLSRDVVQRRLAHVAVCACIAYFVVVGCLGIDYGEHWDEWYHFQGLKSCVDSLTWFPQHQIYNSFYFLIGLPFVLVRAAPFLPRILDEVVSHSDHSIDISLAPAVKEAQQAIDAYLDSPEYKLEVRCAFVCVTSLAILWIYLTARRLHPRHNWAAVAAAAVVALSWEVGYHARWIAVDDVIIQFVALDLYACCRAWRAADRVAMRRWAALAAAAAAGAWAGKTTAIFVLLPVLGLVLRPGLRGDDRRWTAATVVGVYFATAFVLSPSAFLDPLRYVATMAVERHNYNYTDDLYAYFVPTWAGRIARIGAWLFLVVPSPLLALSAAIGSITGVGIWIWVRRDRVAATWAACLALFIVFVATNRNLIVRNCLFVVPFLAVSLGVGLARLDRLLPVWVRRTAWGIVIVAIAWNGWWGVHAALSIRRQTAATVLEAFRRDRASAHAHFRLSPALAAALGESWTAGAGCRPISEATGAPPDTVYLFYREHQWNRFTNNRLGALAAFYGPLDANYDWYITFAGKVGGERIVGVSPARAKEMRLDMSGYRDCAR
jgi:hypothetical protein